MNPFCEACGIFHPTGECDTIRELRARRVPLMLDQLTLTDVTPALLCVACGARVDGYDMLCVRCEGAVRVAEHTGDTDNLSAAQRAVLGIDEWEEREA